MRTAIVIYLLTNFFYAFSQEKVYIKGVYEIRNDKEDHDKNRSDTICYRRVTLREAITARKLWIPWKKYKFRVIYAGGLDFCVSSHRFLIGKENDISSLMTVPWECPDSLNYYVVVDRFFPDGQTTIECQSDERFYNKLEQVSKKFSYYVKKSFDNKYCYHAYYIEGEALKYTYDKEEFKKICMKIENCSTCLSGCLCSENNTNVDVYYIYNITKLENVEVPDEYIWKY